jgi:hypothetical protein
MNTDLLHTRPDCTIPTLTEGSAAGRRRHPPHRRAGLMIAAVMGYLIKDGRQR